MKPWEKYATAAPVDGPWSKYAAAAQDQEVETPDVSKWESRLRGFGQGFTLGFQDELAGVLEAIQGGDYSTGRDTSRERNEAALKANPGNYRGGDVVGSILPVVATGGKGLIARGASRLVPTTVKGLAGIGAAGGLGRSDADNVAEMAVDAGTGAALGAGVGVASQAVGAGARAIREPVGKSAKWVGTKLAEGIEKAVGIPARSTESLFTKPASLFTAPTKKQVSKAYSKSEIPTFGSKGEQSVDDIIARGKGSPTGLVSRGTRAWKDYIESGKADPHSILEGRRGLDQQIGKLESQLTGVASGRSRSALYDTVGAKRDLRQSFNRALDIFTPKLREADALAAERFAVAPFRSVTLPGKINIFSPAGIARALPGLPTAAGLGVSAAGGVAKGVGAVASQSPRVLPYATLRISAMDLQDRIKNDPQAFGKFAPALQKAAQEGPESVAVVNYVLGQSDVEYQKILQGMGDQEENRFVR